MGFSPESLYRLLLWSVLGLSLGIILLIFHATLQQLLADRRNARRIACFRRWEVSVPRYLFGAGPIPPDIATLPRPERTFFRLFLQRLRASLGGAEAEGLTNLYFLAELDRTVPERLHGRSARVRALAAMEVWGFGLWQHLPDLVLLLEDSHPYVAFAAARAIARSRDLTYAPRLLRWVLAQGSYQRERILLSLEPFGPDLVSWLDAFLPPPEDAPEGWCLFALLAGSHRHALAIPRLLALLDADHREVRCAAIRALQTLGDPLAFAKVADLAGHPDDVIRLRATAALGPLGGPAAIPLLKDRLADPSFEIRRHAGQGLSDLGPAGLRTLRALLDDPLADRFARDMAQERLAWIRTRERT
jgi:HEAT repeat protein